MVTNSKQSSRCLRDTNVITHFVLANAYAACTYCIRIFYLLSAIPFQICTVTFVTFANWFSYFKFLQEFATAIYKFTNDNITKALRIDLQESQILRRLPCVGR